MQKLLIDTDPGDDIDDMLALAFALCRPELEIVGITTVTPFPEQRARLVQTLLRTMDRDDVPVAAGMAAPLRSVPMQERDRWHISGGYVMNHGPAAAEDIEPSEFAEDAASLIIRVVEANPGEVAIAGIGPMTNLAVAFARRPEIAPKIRWIALMGGELHLNRTEHNVTWDSVAADIVLSSGAPIFLGTWDVTRRVALSPEDCAKIRSHGASHTDLLARCIDLWWSHKGTKTGPVMYDLAPILWSFDRSYYHTEPKCVHVETRGEWTRGMTVARSGTPNAEVTTDMSSDRAEAARTLLLETLLGSV